MTRLRTHNRRRQRQLARRAKWAKIQRAVNRISDDFLRQVMRDMVKRFGGTGMLVPFGAPFASGGGLVKSRTSDELFVMRGNEMFIPGAQTLNWGAPPEGHGEVHITVSQIMKTRRAWIDPVKDDAE